MGGSTWLRGLAPSESASSTALEPDGTTASRTAPFSRWAVVLLVLAPAVIGVLTAVGVLVRFRTWLPVGDEAAMLVRARDVVSLHPPLMGVYSTRGFAHLGPANFFLLSLFSAFGLLKGPGVFAATAASTGCISSMLIYCCQRWGSVRLFLASAGCVAAMVLSLGARNLASFWNPYMAVVWMVVANVVSAGLATGGLPPRIRCVGLAVVVFAGSVAAQCHLAFVAGATIAASVGVVASVYWMRREGGADYGPSERFRGVRKLLFPAFATFAICWVLPVADWFVGSHNAVRIAKYFRSDGSTIGHIQGLRIAGLSACPWCDVATGRYHYDFGGVTGVPVLAWVASVIFLWTLVMWTLRRHQVTSSLVWLIPAANVLVAGVLAGSLYGFVFEYLLTWLIPIWISIVFAGVFAVSASPRFGLQKALGCLTAVVFVFIAVTFPAKVSLPSSPDNAVIIRASNAIRRDAAGLPLFVDYRDDPIGVVGPAVIWQLMSRDPRTTTSDGSVGVKWGRNSLPSVGPTPKREYLLAIRYHDDSWSAQNICVLGAGHVLGRFNSLTPSEGDEFYRLRLENVASRGRLDAAKRIRLQYLSDRSVEIAVVVPAPGRALGRACR